ncbi:MAG: cupin domain-containing protein [Oscillospiraceae bacterium]|nr:cupin domain-containing protein [Oscillospiraceae bacterium]
MDNIIEIKDYTGEGYKPQVDFGAWRVAIANFKPDWAPGAQTYIERHMETDEVFVLLAGEVSLLIGKEMQEYKMEPGKIFNVKAGTWHQLQMSEDGKVLIVENRDTGRANSEYLSI